MPIFERWAIVGSVTSWLRAVAAADSASNNGRVDVQGGKPKNAAPRTMPAPPRIARFEIRRRCGSFRLRHHRIAFGVGPSRSSDAEFINVR
jgi:hypothetical protein